MAIQFYRVTSYINCCIISDIISMAGIDWQFSPDLNGIEWLLNRFLAIAKSLHWKIL